MNNETTTKISISGKEVKYIDLINAGRYGLCNQIDDMIDELRDLKTAGEKRGGIFYGNIRVWEE